MEDINRKKIGVIGLGAVGKATKHAMSYWFDCIAYDIIGEHNWNDMLDAEMVMICVSTPENGNGRLDCTNVDDVLIRLSNDGYKGLVIVKSTIGIGYMNKVESMFLELRLVYMPEFLREKSNFLWFVNPDRLVVSGKPEYCEDALTYFNWVEEDVPRLIMDHLSAEIGKLSHNAYIATKVSFTNEIENICEECGGDPMNVMSVIWADRRVKSREHLTPFRGHYGGKCVPKDTRELLNATKKSVLLRAVEEVNQAKKGNSNGRMTIEKYCGCNSYQEPA